MQGFQRGTHLTESEHSPRVREDKHGPGIERREYRIPVQGSYNETKFPTYRTENLPHMK